LIYNKHDKAVNEVKYANRLKPTGEIYTQPTAILGHAVAQLVEALRYKSEGRGFDSGCFH
jgi:hypothetical protein